MSAYRDPWWVWEVIGSGALGTHDQREEKRREGAKGERGAGGGSAACCAASCINVLMGRTRTANREFAREQASPFTLLTWGSCYVYGVRVPPLPSACDWRFRVRTLLSQANFVIESSVQGTRRSQVFSLICIPFPLDAFRRVVCFRNATQLQLQLQARNTVRVGKVEPRRREEARDVDVLEMRGRWGYVAIG